MRIIGHRGAKGLAPENTLASLKKARKYQVDELEIDVRVTKDNVVILHHDPYMLDPNGDTLQILETPYKVLKKHKKDLTTFEEALSYIDKKTQLYVEIKPDVPVKPVIKIIKEHLNKGWAADNFLIASFSQDVLVEAHQLLPGVEKVVLENWSSIRARRRAKEVNTKRLSMNQKWLWGGFIAAMTLGGYKLYAYTVNNPKRAKRFKKYGLYGVITDFPDLFHKK